MAKCTWNTTDMNTQRLCSFLLVLMCTIVLVGCERQTATPSSPGPQTVSGMTRDRTSYTFLKWNGGLAIMLVDRCDVHSMSGSSSSGKSHQRRGDAHWWDRTSDEWEVGYEWRLQATDAQQTVFAINNIEYDLSEGAVFRIDTSGDEAAVTQINRDLSRIEPHRNACEHFVATTAELRKRSERSNTE
jgi:hypothetical protein